MEEYVDIVDENDNIIGKLHREECHKKGILHRIVLGIVMNSKKEILIVTRARARKHGSGLLDASIGGHVSSGESYEDAIIREGEEELGIRGEYKLLFKFHSDHPEYNHMTAVFLINHEGPFKIDPLESDEVIWMKPEEIIKIPREKFTKAAYEGAKKVYSYLLQEHWML